VTWLGEPPAPAAVGMPRRAIRAAWEGPAFIPKTRAGPLPRAKAAARALRLGASGRGAVRRTDSCWRVLRVHCIQTCGAARRWVQRRCSIYSLENVTSASSRIAAAKAFLEQKFHLTVCGYGLGNPRWRDDDPTSNLFGSDARVDTLACRVGIVAWRRPAR